MTEIVGTEGADTLYTGSGTDVVRGLGGDDVIQDLDPSSFPTADWLYGGEGNDRIYGAGGDDRLFGDAGNDELSGGAGADILDGGGGNDLLSDTAAGGDTLLGGDDDDILSVDHTHVFTMTGTVTTLDGGAGNDRIIVTYSRTAETRVIGGAGDDHILLARTSGATSISLGAGADTIELDRNLGGWPLTGIRISDFDTGAGGDRIAGMAEFLFYAIGPWNGVANPFAANQIRLRQAGADTLLEIDYMGTGSDWRTAFIFENLAASSLTAAHLGGFDPNGAVAAPLIADGTGADESWSGNQGSDIIHGLGGNDMLLGEAGNDSLYGGDGDDRLDGGMGTDLLDGGDGNDEFYVTASGADTVIGGAGDDYLYYRRDDRYFQIPAIVPASHIDMGEGNDRLDIQNYGQRGGETILYVDAGAGDDVINSRSGTPYVLTLGAGADTINLFTAIGAVTVTDFNPAEDRFASLMNFLHADTDWSTGDPYAQGFIRLVQQGADTLVQTTPFTTPYYATPIVLQGVDARTLTALNFGGYAPDGIWSFGTGAANALAGGAGNDRLSDDQGGADTLDGAAGNDIISWSRNVGAAAISYAWGGAGDDRINIAGGAGSTLYADGGADRDDIHLAGVSGTAILTLGAGQDLLTFDSAGASLSAAGIVSVTDFQVGAGGDALVLTPFLAAWLTGWNGTANPFATGHVRLAQSGAATLLQFDRNGGGDAWATVLTFQNAAASAFTAFNLGGWDSLTFGNQAPAFAANAAGTASYFENGAAIPLAPLATLADMDSADFAGGSLTVSLAGATAGDQIVLASNGAALVSGTNVSWQGVAIGTLSGGTGGTNLVLAFNGNANAAAVEAVVRNLVWANSSDALATGPRAFTVAVTDGDGGAALFVATIDAFAINDAPAIANLAGDAAQFLEGSGPIRLDAGTAVSVSDLDSLNFSGGLLTVAIGAGLHASEDSLDVATGSGIFISGFAGVFSVSVDGATIGTVDGQRGTELLIHFNDSATPARVARLLGALTYANSAYDAPNTATRTIDYTLIDGDGAQYGGQDTRTFTSAIEIIGHNSVPTLTAPFNDTETFTEGGNFGQLMAGVSLDDVEFRAGYGGGSMTLTVTGVDGAIALPSWSSFHAVASGGGFDLVYDWFDGSATTPVLVGRIAGLGSSTIVVDSFNPVYFNIFSYLLSAFTFGIAGDAPSAGTRYAILTFSDGGNGTGAMAQSATRIQTIEVVGINDAPAIGNLQGDTVQFIEQGARIRLDAGNVLTVTDPDSLDFAGGSLHVRISGNCVASEDQLLIGTAFGVAVSAGQVSVQGVLVGTLSGTATDMVFAFNASATAASVYAILRSLDYYNSNFVAPSTATRMVDFTLVDGDGTASGGQDSVTVYSLVNVSQVNDIPQLANPADLQLTYTEGAPVGLMAGVLLSDGEAALGFGGGSLGLAATGADSQLALRAGSAFRAIGGDLIHVTVSGGVETGILIGHIAGLGTASVTVDGFTAAATLAMINDLIDDFAFFIPGDDPRDTGQTVTLSFNDGGNGTGLSGLSANRMQGIAVAGVNDAPLLAGAAPAALAYTPGATAAQLFSGVTFADPDHPASLSGGTLTLSTAPGADFVLTGARFLASGANIFDTQTGFHIGSMSAGAGTLSVALGAGASEAAVQALARSFGFHSNGAAAAADYVVELRIGDGALVSNIVTQSVAVGALLRGGEGSDALTGGASGDRLVGGHGADLLTGGGGADIFAFESLADSHGFALRSDGGKLAPDRIADFQSGLDRIDLSAIDAIAGTAANDAFTAIGTAAFTGHAGELRWETIAGTMHIYGDGDGNGLADFEIIAATPILQATDFIL